MVRSIRISFLRSVRHSFYSLLNIACRLSMEFDPWRRRQNAFDRCRPRSTWTRTIIQSWGRYSFPAFHSKQSDGGSENHVDRCFNQWLALQLSSSGSSFDSWLQLRTKLGRKHRTNTRIFGSRFVQRHRVRKKYFLKSWTQFDKKKNFQVLTGASERPPSTIWPPEIASH